jgi:hypothetical protein
MALQEKRMSFKTERKQGPYHCTKYLVHNPLQFRSIGWSQNVSRIFSEAGMSLLLRGICNLYLHGRRNDFKTRKVIAWALEVRSASTCKIIRIKGKQKCWHHRPPVLHVATLDRKLSSDDPSTLSLPVIRTAIEHAV